MTPTQSTQQNLQAVIKEKDTLIKNLNKSIVGLQISKNKFFQIQKVIHDMNASQDVHEIGDMAISYIVNIINFFYVELRIFEGNLCLTKGDLPEDAAGDDVPLDESTIQWSMDSNRPLFSSIFEEADQSVRGKLFILVPIGNQQQAFGYFKIHPTKKEDNITQDELSFLMVLANNLANALENAMLNRHTIQMKNFYNRIINSMSYGILTISVDGVITYLNKNAEFLLGLGSETPENPEYDMVLDPKLIKIFTELLDQTQETGPVADYEYEHTIGEGVQVPLGISTSLIRDENGEIEATIFVLRDLTLTREIMKLKQLDSMKSEFIHAVTHEFRNPLTSIMVVSDLLGGLTEEKKIPREKISEFVGMIRSQSQSLTDLIDDLLDIARMESNRFQLHPEKVSLKELVESASQDVGASAADKSITIKDTIKKDVSLFVDRKQFRRVLLNLMSNAIKYSHQGGQVTVGTRKQSGGGIKIYVKDTGIGIGGDDIDKIFDKFYRIYSEETEDIKGHGLGLSIVKQIIDSHGGSVQVNSKKGKGSTFEIVMPPVPDTLSHMFPTQPET